MFEPPQLADQWESSIHSFIEECDSPQGFQVFVDTDGGFGGLAAGLLDSLRDIHGNKPVLTFALGEAGSAPTSVRPCLIVNGQLKRDKLYWANGLLSYVRADAAGVYL